MLDKVFNPQAIIDEWNAMNEQAQYNMLKYNIISASKRFNRAFALKLNEPEELIGEAWLTLQSRLNAEHIQSLADRRAETISLNFVVLTAASNTLTHVMYNHKWKNQEYGNSLNRLVGNDENTELLELLPDKNNSVEEQVISRIMVDEMLKDLKPRQKTFIFYTMYGCTPTEISDMTGTDRKIVGQCLRHVRKKLGRVESAAEKLTAINFDMFTKAYEMVLAKKVKARHCMRELGIAETTFYRYAAKYKQLHNMTVPQHYLKLKSFQTVGAFS